MTVVAVVVGLALPASAHAALVASSPASQARLDAPPTEIVLTFDEPVEATLGGIRLYDSEEHRIDVGEASRSPSDDQQLSAPIEEALDDGLFVVTWHATSEDGHPISGAFTFQVGDVAPSDTSGLIARLLAGEGDDSSVGALLAFSRFVAYVGLALLIGGFAFLALAWPVGADRVGARRLLWLGWGLALLGAIGTFVLQGPYASGDSLAAVVDTGLWRDVADTRTGQASLIRLAAVAVAGLLVAMVRSVRQAWWQALAATTAAVLAYSAAYAGHAGTGRWHLVGLLLGTLHVGAVSVWAGGIAYLAFAALRPAASTTSRSVGAAVATTGEDRTVPGDAVTVAVQRFSVIAIVAVAVAVGTGVLQGWRLVESPSALWDTDYGRLLLVKTALVAAIVLVAAAARRLVRRRWPAPGQLRRVVLAEVVLAVAVLGVTAVLVGTAPTVDKASAPFSTTLVQADTIASISVDPARSGVDNALHVYVSPPGGSLSKVDSVTARVTLPERELGPIPVPLAEEGVNHYSAYGLQLPFDGEWQLEVLAAIGDQTLRFSTLFTVD
jgi:copper transport protein